MKEETFHNSVIAKISYFLLNGGLSPVIGSISVSFIQSMSFSLRLSAGLFPQRPLR